MWALLVCVLVKPVEIANGLDLQHGTSAECLDVATDEKGGRTRTSIDDKWRTLTRVVANHSGEGQNFELHAIGQQGLRKQSRNGSSEPHASPFHRGAFKNSINLTMALARALDIQSIDATTPISHCPRHPND